MRRRIIVLAAFVGVMVPAIAAAASEGILVLAHNGTATWTEQVKELAAKVDKQTPIEVLFGSPTRPMLTAAVERMAQRGATEVVAVPFFSSISISREDLTGHAVPVRVATATAAADPLFADLVLSRANEVSPAEADVLVVVGYGSEDSGKPWAIDLAPLAKQLNGSRRFASILTIAKPVGQTEAEQQQIRIVLQRQVAAGRTILVVSMLDQGEKDATVEQMLQGFSYRTAKGGVLTDDRVAEWLAKQATTAAR